VIAGFDHGVTNATGLLKAYIPRESIDPRTGEQTPLEVYICGEFYRYRSDDWQNNVDENVAEMKKMPDLERARWIKADPSIFYDAVATDKGAPTNIYATYKKNGMWPMTSYDGIRSDVTFVEWIMSDWWKGISGGRKPRLHIVCRNPSDRPQPGLHPFDCPNLLWEMKRAKRVQMTSRQLLTKNASEALVNKNNHLLDPCLIAGTLVTARRGQVPIEQVVAGEEVWTRAGWRKVERSWMTDPASTVYRVTFSNGVQVVATENHKFFTASGEFVRLDALKRGTVCVCENRISAGNQKSLNGWGLSSIDTPTHPGDQTDCISAEELLVCTASAGYLPTENRSLRTVISIISTTTSRITNLKTSKPRMAASTSESIKQTRGSKVLNGLSTSPASGERPRLGIVVQQERHGTVKTPVASFVRSATRYALTAATPFKTKTRAEETHFVRRNVAVVSEFQASHAKSSVPACSVEVLSPATTDQLQDTVPQLAWVSVVEVRKCHRVQPVYDLTVEGEHEFFANGILVHNCKQILGTLRNPTEVPREEIIGGLLQGLDPFTAGLRGRFLMSQEALEGKLGPDGKPRKKKSAPLIDLRKAPGVMQRPR
jgi:hypothetical protein